MARKSPEKMTTEEINAEISELEASNQKVGGTYARIAKLAGEKSRRIKGQLSECNQLLGELVELEKTLKGLRQ